MDRSQMPQGGVITSRQNPRVQQIRRLLSSRREREQAGLFVADGTKLLAEAVRWWPGLETVVLTPQVEAQLPPQTEVLRVSPELMTYLSPMETPQGALFVCRLPQGGDFAPRPGMLLLDGIQDPGNLGTILRTADAFGIPVALLEGCADPFSHKVVRASMGAVFRTPPVQATWTQAESACRRAGIPIGVTALTDAARDIRTADLAAMAVVIGSEGQGVRREILENADEALIIPMQSRCESLNAAVAATVVLWQMQ